MKPEDLPVPAGARPAQVFPRRAGQAGARSDWLAEELPVALVYNGISHAVMMATPADLEDFAVGFSFTEGIVDAPGEIYDLEVLPRTEGIELHLELSSMRFQGLKERRRSMAGRTGCGLCGTDSLEQVHQKLQAVAPFAVEAQALARAASALRSAQDLLQRTGAVHAAAWCSPEGEPRIVREDVGRHNALDKVIGAALRGGVPLSQGFLCITSRASFEMVQKSVRSGVGLMAAVSAPTGLAVDLAQRMGLALAGFLRGDEFVAYTYPNRFGLPGSAAEQESDGDGH